MPTRGCDSDRDGNHGTKHRPIARAICHHQEFPLSRLRCFRWRGEEPGVNEEVGGAGHPTRSAVATHGRLRGGIGSERGTRLCGARLSDLAEAPFEFAFGHGRPQGYRAGKNLSPLKAEGGPKSACLRESNYYGSTCTTCSAWPIRSSCCDCSAEVVAS